MNSKILLVSLTGAIFFGIIDALFFLLVEKKIQKRFYDISYFDKSMAELATGGLAAAIAIFASSFINVYLRKYYTFVENPILDFLGIIIGTIFVIFHYYLYKKYVAKNKKTN